MNPSLILIRIRDNESNRGEAENPMPLETIYLYTLIITGLITIVYLFFSDLVDGIGEGIPFFDPAVVMTFITLTSAGGYLLERFTSLNNFIVFIISVIIGAVLSGLLYFFLLVPLRSAEVSLVYTDESLAGQIGKVIVPIPKDGFGEVVIEAGGGIISKRATSLLNEEIAYEREVLIIEVKEGTLYVKEYQPFWTHS